jgi:Leucine-rich repeat (LRR) protein
MKNSRSGLARSGQYPETIEFGKPKSSTLVFQFKGDFSRLLSSSAEQLSILTELDLADNTITNLPEELKQLENLRKLTLRQNRLEALPEWFFQHFVGLQMLNLGYNKLRTIQPAFNNFKEIKYIYVDHNQLSKFPTEICQLTSLIGK